MNTSSHAVRQRRDAFSSRCIDSVFAPPRSRGREAVAERAEGCRRTTELFGPRPRPGAREPAGLRYGEILPDIHRLTPGVADPHAGIVTATRKPDR